MKIFWHEIQLMKNFTIAINITIKLSISGGTIIIVTIF